MQASSPQKKASSSKKAKATPNINAIDFRVDRPYKRLDMATVLGLFSVLAFIALAIYIGQSDANFFNVPSFLIVICGTIAATSISYTAEELGKAGTIIGKTIVRVSYDHAKLSRSLLDLSLLARKRGVLALSAYQDELQKIPYLNHVIQMVVDGYKADDIERLLQQEIYASIERHKRSASITRRASEVAPAMGLIGTLVGLVQMLADLENPETIGPAMAIALLTTFYGAILGTIIMAPLAIKLEKNSADESLAKTLMATAAISIARQENPRRLEMLLNSELPPSEQINYFESE